MYWFSYCLFLSGKNLTHPPTSMPSRGESIYALGLRYILTTKPLQFCVADHKQLNFSACIQGWELDIYVTKFMTTIFRSGLATAFLDYF